MTGADFKAWLFQMGISQYRAAKLLGASRGAITSWLSRGAPLYVGLACAALLAGLEPFTRREREPGE